MLVVYICKTNYEKLLNIESLKICATTFVMYEVLLMYKTILKKHFEHLEWSKYVQPQTVTLS
jgi:hypothetical protein